MISNVVLLDTKPGVWLDCHNNVYNWCEFHAQNSNTRLERHSFTNHQQLLCSGFEMPWNNADNLCMYAVAPIWYYVCKLTRCKINRVQFGEHITRNRTLSEARRLRLVNIIIYMSIYLYIYVCIYNVYILKVKIATTLCKLGEELLFLLRQLRRLWTESG